ncbi:MAG: hypothetical protein HY904_12245 [Deltaproteobacteria bacterium]|nr:hypothetical protein [Deltaproteobacteria bacterium]
MLRNRNGLLAVALGLVGGGCVYCQDVFPDLEPGDVTGVLVGTPPGATQEGPLAGGRVLLRQGSQSRVTRSDGRFTVRNLPQGTHVLLMSYDPDHDGVADLAKVVEAAIRVPAGKEERARVDMGRIVLLPPATLNGRVLPPAVNPGCVDMATVRVIIDGTPVLVVPAADGTFTVRGLGAWTWTVVAAGTGALTAHEVTVESGQTAELGDLRLECVSTPTTLTVQFDQPAGPGATPSEGLPLLDSNLAAACPLGASPPDGCPPAVSVVDTAGDLLQTVTFLDLVPGVYRVDVNVPEWLPITFGHVLLSGEPREISLTVTPRKFNDLDGDDLQALDQMGMETCHAACVQDPTAPCESRDCDDDGDGQFDMEELAGCGQPGEVPTPSNEDPRRYDLDHDGICDGFEAQGNGGGSGGSSSSSGGVSSSSGPASGTSLAPSSGASASSQSSTSRSAPAPSSSGAATSTLPPSSAAASTQPSSSAAGGSSTTGRSSSGAASSVGGASSAARASSGTGSSGGAMGELVHTFPAGAAVLDLATDGNWIAWVVNGQVQFCQAPATAGCTATVVPTTMPAPAHVAVAAGALAWSDHPAAGTTAALETCALPNCTPSTAAPPLRFAGALAAKEGASGTLLLGNDYVPGMGGGVVFEYPWATGGGMPYFQPVTNLQFMQLASGPTVVAWVRSGSQLELCTPPGGSCTATFPPGSVPASDVAVDATHIYFSGAPGQPVSRCTVAEATGAGTASTCTAQPVPGLLTAQPPIAVGGGFLYWVADDATARTLRRVTIP